MKTSIFSFIVLSIVLILTGCEKEDDKKPLPGNVIGIVVPEMDANKAFIRSQEAKLGNLICDAYMEYTTYKGFAADFAIVNSGNIRFNPDLHPDGIYPANLNVDTATVYEIFPWETGEISFIELSGSDLLSTFERSVASLPPTTSSYNGCFLQVSGALKVVYNLSRQAQIIDKTDPENPFIATEGQRVVSLKINNVDVVSTQTYHIILPKWISDGGDDYLALKNIAPSKKQDIEENPVLPMTTERNALIYYLKKYQTLNPAIENRISFTTK